MCVDLDTTVAVCVEPFPLSVSFSWLLSCFVRLVISLSFLRPPRIHDNAERDVEIDSTVVVDVVSDAW